MEDFNIMIIGAGVVGLAIAENLSQKYDDIIVVEKHNSFGQETSSRNSEVIHAGMYYPKNSLKAKLCVAGNRSLYEFCEKYDVEYEICGKYIIAINDEDMTKLDNIYKQGIENGVDIRYADLGELKEKEPFVKCKAALFSPNTGIINSHNLMETLKNNAEKNKCDFAFNHEVYRIVKDSDHYRVFVKDKDGFDFETTAKCIINAGGLTSDIIAQNAGFDIDNMKYRQNYCRGHYFKLAPKYKNKIKHLIYPVPSNNYGIGIHITKDISGYLKLGPDTEFLNHRNQEYKVDNNLQDKFFRAVSSYIREIEFDDLSPDQSGIRPKLQKQGEGFRDFIIQEESGNNMRNLINLIGIESPGLTCSIEIGKYISKILEI